MENSKLYVGNLSYSVSELQLKELFSKHGEVKEVTLIAGKGFGFVVMSNSEEAVKAKEALNGTQWEGRTIKVDEARPISPKKSTGGYQDRNSGFNKRGGFQKRDYRR